MEREFEGDWIARILRGPKGNLIAAALVGCHYYRDDPDDLEVISACDLDAATLLVRRCGRERRTALAAGYILCSDSRLDDAISLAETDDDRERRKMERRVAAFGITARMEEEDLVHLCEALEGASTGRLPPHSIRTRIIAIVQKYGPDRCVRKLLEDWVANIPREQPVPGDMIIQLTAVLRGLGELDKALQWTDALNSPFARFTKGEKCVLLNQRASLWLDLYEIRGDAKLLRRARECAKKSWAIQPSNECGNVYERLKRIEADQDADLTRVQNRERAKQAEAVEAKWLNGRDIPRLPSARS